MEITSFLVGVLSTLFAYALFKDKSKVEPELVEGLDDDDEYEDTKGRRVTMMCTSCRKQKPHIEIEKDLYQCTKCKRQVDLRR